MAQARTPSFTDKDAEVTIMLGALPHWRGIWMLQFANPAVRDAVFDGLMREDKNNSLASRYIEKEDATDIRIKSIAVQQAGGGTLRWQLEFASEEMREIFNNLMPAPYHKDDDENTFWLETDLELLSCQLNLKAIEKVEEEKEEKIEVQPIDFDPTRIPPQLPTELLMENIFPLLDAKAFGRVAWLSREFERSVVDHSSYWRETVKHHFPLAYDEIVNKDSVKMTGFLGELMSRSQGLLSIESRIADELQELKKTEPEFKEFGPEGIEIQKQLYAQKLKNQKNWHQTFCDLYAKEYAPTSEDTPLSHHAAQFLFWMKDRNAAN